MELGTEGATTREEIYNQLISGIGLNRDPITHAATKTNGKIWNAGGIVIGHYEVTE